VKTNFANNYLLFEHLAASLYKQMIIGGSISSPIVNKDIVENSHNNNEKFNVLNLSLILFTFEIFLD
jgi:hypothetical protein